MAAAATQAEEDNKSWEDMLRRMLPPGAPLPDPDHLDYSIAVEYEGPPVDYDLPRIQPLEPSSSVNSDGRRDRSDHFRSGSAGSSRSSLGSARPSSSAFNSRSQSQREDGAVESDGEEQARASSSSFAAGSSERAPVPESRKAAVVTFSTSGLSDRDDAGSADCEADEGGSGSVSPSMVSSSSTRSTQRRKKGLCTRCLKVNILKERVGCLVCDARYCGSCVLKAMGSMPEGRKCVSCIGEPIDEAKRPTLGKASRTLSKVFTHLEVRQIMKAEKECPANQLRPQQLVINGRQLQQEELDEIFGCPNPPVKLKPGRYWYDKDSGLWGKEGQKPDQIITSKLNIGGKLQPDASNGNTKVFINSREITKVELRMLKLANVQCVKGTNFWVYDDGSYEEEGQNNIKGKIWEKASTRLICSLFSLPTPPEALPGSNGDASAFSTRSVPEYLEQKRVQKLLLLGLEGSGTSTIFKQAKFLYGNNFSPEELERIKLMIQSNLYKYIGTLLEGREHFEEEALKEIGNSDVKENGLEKGRHCAYSINQNLKHFSDWLLDIVAMGDLETFFPAATREYAPVVDDAWKDSAIQETYKRRNELHALPEVAGYFLDRAIEISSNEYEPSEKDILFAEGVDQCNGVTCLDFSLDDRSPMSDAFGDNFDCAPQLIKYQVIRVNSKGLSEACKWLDMFADVRAVIFCVALSDYDQVWSSASSGGSGIPCNKMLASRDLFQSLIRHPSFKNTPFILVLNKYDVFEDKINRGVPLTVCEWFHDFSPLRTHNNNHSLAQSAYYYVAVKFKDLYQPISDRKLFVCQTKARERATVDEAFKYIREVLKWEDMKNDMCEMVDDSFYSTEDLITSPYMAH